MLKERFKIMEIDLSLFDEGAAAPAASSGGGQSAEMGGTEVTGDASQESSEDVEVVYGKQPEETTEVEGTQKEGLEDTTLEGKEGSDPKKSDTNYDFDTLLKTDESFKKQYDERVQNIINKRFKETKQLQEKVEQVDPVLDILKERYGVEDTEKLLQTLKDESYQELAYKNNMEPEQFKRMKELERENKLLKHKKNTEESQQQVEQRVKQWYDEAEEVKQDYPDFDLKEASKNPDFLKLLKAGVNVKAAFQATNFENILKNKLSAATEKVKENVTESIKSKSNRVKENGTSSSPGKLIKSDPSSLTKEDRAEIARRVKNGEKISF